MQEDNNKMRMEVQQAAKELITLLFAVTESELQAPPEQQPTARHKTLAALTLATNECIRAFLQAADHMK